MIGKKMLAMLGIAVLGASLAASPAHAVKGCAFGKKGVKGCKNELQGCIALNGCKDKTKFPKKKDRKTCAKTCKTTLKTACSTAPTVCTSSASGAFLSLSSR